MPDKEGQLAGPAIMVLSAMIFGFFGFRMSATAADGEFVLFFALLTWTLRISAGLFVLSAGLTFVVPVAACWLLGVLILTHIPQQFMPKPPEGS